MADETTYYTVTVVIDYSTDKLVDEDVLHDAIKDNFDTVDLEFTTEAPTYDENDEELEETETIAVNADNIRSVEVVKVVN